MRIALLSDIHGNLHALQSCLEKARAQGAERCDFPGGLSACSTDPRGAIDLIADHVANQASANGGKHVGAMLIRKVGPPEASALREECGH